MHNKYWGVLISIFSIIFVILQIVRCPFLDWIPLYIELTYVGLFLILVGLAWFLYYSHKNLLLKRRKVDESELKSLFSEVNMFKSYSSNKDCLEVANNEVDKIQGLLDNKDGVYELDALPLRKALVDLYPKEELSTKAQEELRLIWEYTPDTPAYEDIHEDWKKRIETAEKIQKDWNKEKSNDPTLEDRGRSKKLRSELKALREVVAWYDKTWAEGEIYINAVTYWAACSVFVMLVVGTLPLIHIQANHQLGFFHWGALGWCGAMLATIMSINKLDKNEVGEQDGKQVILQTIGKVAIGVVSSVLLYATLLGGLLSGKMFPTKLTDLNVVNNPDWLNIGLTVFWGIFGGLSIKILKGLISIAESPFGQDNS